jgi:hypothetical protein
MLSCHAVDLLEVTGNNKLLVIIMSRIKFTSHALLLLSNFQQTCPLTMYRYYYSGKYCLLFMKVLAKDFSEYAGQAVALVLAGKYTVCNRGRAVQVLHVRPYS